MSAVRRLAGFICLLALLAGAVLWITRESARPRESYQEIGLRWLRDEYRLDDATFEKVAALHHAYFATCSQMCRQIKEATRPLLMQTRRQPLSTSTKAGLRQQEQKLCDDCELAAKKHLLQVADLMPEEQRQRFLDDMLSTLETQRLQHDLDMSAHTRR
ncbi:MAG: hypothetical protein ACO1TE_00390 [Prosthecobacter sp.]